MDFLARNQAPISREQWEVLDDVIVNTIKKYLVGRKIIPIYGPLGAGMPAVMMAKLNVASNAPVTQAGCNLVEFKELNQDFIIPWKTLEMASRLNIPIDWSVAAAAAYQFAIKEDTEIFKHLLETKGKLTLKPGDWAIPGGVIGDVTKAIGKMASSGHLGPYAIVLSPTFHSILYRVVGHSGTMEITILEDLMKSGVYTTNHLNNNQLLIIETGSMNMDIALGMDAKTAYMGQTEMDHIFRILETMVLRIKRESSICLIEK